MNPSSGSIICQIEYLIELRKSLSLPARYVMKDTGEDANEVTNKDVPRARSRRVLSAGTSVPIEQECVTLSVGAFASLETLNAILWGFYGGFIMQARSIINSIFSPFPSRELWMGLKIPSSQSWLGFSGGQPPSGAYPESTALNGKTLTTWQVTRVSGTLCQNLESQTNTYIFHYLTR